MNDTLPIFVSHETETGITIDTLIREIFLSVFPAHSWRDEAGMLAYARQIATLTNAVPADSLHLPKAGAIGAALDASKYVYGDSEVNDLFAGLIAASIHVDRADAVMPSFAYVAQQLSPLDIRILRTFRPKIMITELERRTEPGAMVYINPTTTPFYLRQTFPIINYALYTKDEGKHTVASNVYGELPELTDIYQTSSCIGNLSRLGLIGVSFLESLYNDEDYYKFTQTEFCTMLREFAIGDGKRHRGGGYLRLGGQRIAAGAYERLEIEKGCTRLTDYGIAFTDVCLFGDR